MGSPYLIAAGIAKPVKDAVATASASASAVEHRKEVAFESLFLLIVFKRNQLDFVLFHISAKLWLLVPIGLLGVFLLLNLKAVEVDLLVWQLHLRVVPQETDLDQEPIHVLGGVSSSGSLLS
jgi:hypothetical protein